MITAFTELMTQNYSQYLTSLLSMEMNLFTFLPFFQAVGTIGTGAFFFSTPETRSTPTARGAWQLVHREMQQRF